MNKFPIFLFQKWIEKLECSIYFVNLHVKPFTKVKIQTDAAFSAVSNLCSQQAKTFLSIWNDSIEWHMLQCFLPNPKKEGSRVEDVPINVNTAMQIKNF